MRRTAGWLLGSAAAILWLGGMTIHLARQEEPTGWLRGKVLVEETGQPLPGVLVRLHLDQPEQAGVDTEYALLTRDDGTFRSGRLPAGSYQVEAASRAHALRAGNLLVEEGKVREVTLELSPVAPFLQLHANQHVFTPDEVPRLTAHGFLSSQELSLQLYRVDPQALFVKQHGSLRGLLGWRTGPALEDNPALTPSERTSVAITRRDIEGVFHQRFALPVDEPGIYLVVARGDSVERREWFMVTRLGLIVKHWQDQALAYVVDLKTGAPVAGARVEFSPQEAKAVSGVTDQYGIFQATVPGQRRYRRLLARAGHEGSEAFLMSWVSGARGDGQERVYAYTDRPVYRPGHDVHFKGIARRFAENNYSVLAEKPVEVKVWDSRDSLIYRGELTTDAFGSYYGDFHLNSEAATGFYRVVSTLEGRPHQANFKVAEYRKPEYTVEVTTSKKRYTRGERIRVKVAAEYYFGAPVTGAEVNYLVRRAAYWHHYDYGEVIEEGEVKTDAEGVARFSIGTKPSPALGRKAPEEEPQDYHYTIEAGVTDPGRRAVTAEGSTLVTQGEFRLVVEPARYVVTPNEPAEVEIQARDYEGRPVRDVSVAMTAQREVWLKGESRRVDEAQASVTTDAKGKARFRFKPSKGGSYRLHARAQDRLGNRIVGMAYLWAAAERYADFGAPYPELEMIADKKVYRVGETAVLLVNTQFAGATALVTVEGPRLYAHRLVDLKGKSTRIELPIREDYAPNFFVSVAFVRDKQFVSDQKRISVSVEERKLKVAVKPDKQRYSPGQRATYQLRTTDWEGKPVSAQLSVGVVDESIYAIQEEMAPRMLGFFYPQRGNAVSTDYSFPQIYLDADKDAATIKVRKRFPDTAYWNPTVVTGPEGEARVSFTMPDTLTTWRATVRGATLDTAVGEAVAKVKSSKDLLVRLEAPRFLVQKDRLTLSAVAHNYTSTDQPVMLWMQAPGLTFVGRDKAGERESLTLAPGEVKRKDWQIAVPAPGSPEVTVYLKAAGGLSDAMALTLPALPHGRERVEWRSGAVQTRTVEGLQVRQDAVPGASDLRVRLAPSIASVMLGALDYLARYPYGCAEQTMSAFLPDVVVARVLRELEIPNPQLEKKLPDMVQKGLNRLYRYQHDDGGWGWWRYDRSDPWMTAYVVFGLLTAKENGFAVNERALSRGLSWLLRKMGERSHQATRDKAYMLYVLSLAESDGAVDRQVTQVYRRLGALDNYGLALLTSTLLERGRTKEARVVGARLWQRAQETQATASWKGGGDWGRGGDIETTALALKALYRLDPEEPRVFKVVRWLVLNREGNHWVSTRDTAFVLFALTDFLKGSRELEPDYQATLALNGKPLLERHFGKESLFDPEVEVRVAGKSLQAGQNLLAVGKEGEGNLYYTLILRQYVGQEDIAKVVTGSGISVERRYYPMVSSRNRRTGVIATRPSPNATTAFRSGEPILARLTISSPKAYDYVVVEDPIPAGCEISERGDLEPWEWNRWWSDMDVRDEKLAIFARRLPAGTSTIEYHLRPQIPGDYHVMPTQVYAMYNPVLRGSGAEARVRLR